MDKSLIKELQISLFELHESLHLFITPQRFTDDDRGLMEITTNELEDGNINQLIFFNDITYMEWKSMMYFNNYNLKLIYRDDL